jgi:hypothetical protein
MKRYVPIPSGVYNIKIVKYEQKESAKQRGQFYYQWTLQVLDALPEDYTGRDTFMVLSPVELTEKNALRKLLNRVGYSEIAIDQEVDLDTLLNHKFVGKVSIKALTNGNEGNDLVDVPLQEYDRFLERQRGGNQPPQRATLGARPAASQASPAAPAPASAPAAPAHNTIPRTAQVRPTGTAASAAARPSARPIAAPSPTPRPTSRPAQRPVAPNPSPAEGENEGGEVYEEDGTAGFPAQV